MMVISKEVVLWGTEDLFSSSIELLLASKKDWNVVSISNKEDFDALILAVGPMQQVIVIIPQGEHNVSANSTMQLLQDHPGLKVITVSLDHNSIEVFSKQKIWVKEASDLMFAIENEP